ncbi:hypothetical protein ACFKKH_00380, partial [Streptococcus agalactiae]|uniref:hypothetical protein n=1 Tax=Streptococcus agalactiae TaxID=1311 RepID=UPI0036306698
FSSFVRCFFVVSTTFNFLPKVTSFTRKLTVQKIQKGNILHGKGRVLKFPNDVSPFKNEGGSFRTLT